MSREVVDAVDYTCCHLNQSSIGTKCQICADIDFNRKVIAGTPQAGGHQFCSNQRGLAYVVAKIFPLVKYEVEQFF